MSKTKIEWTDQSWNPLRASRDGRDGHFCVKVSAGCANCYAENMNRRFGNKLEYKVANVAGTTFSIDEKRLLEPLKRKKPSKYFPCDMTDLFGGFWSDEQRDKIFGIMSQCPRHTFQVLTKRVDKMACYVGTNDDDKLERLYAIADALRVYHDKGLFQQTASTAWPPPNVWFGVSVETQQAADERLPILCSIPAAVRWVSYEPALQAVDFSKWLPKVGTIGMVSPEYAKRTGAKVGDRMRVEPEGGGVQWIVAGGESGNKKRPVDLLWFRNVRDACKEAGVAFFMKQVDKIKAIPRDLLIREFPAQ